MGEANTSSVIDDLLLKNFYAEVSEVERDNEVVRILSCFKLNAFEYLNLPFDSPPEDVKKQYRKLSLLVHPDKCKHPQAKEAFSALAKAQQLLLDPQEREYLVNQINAAREELRAKRKKQLKKDTASKLKSLVDEGKYEQEYEKSDEFQAQLKLKVREILTDQEWRRRKMQMRISEEEGRLKKDEEESKEMWKRKREHEEQWKGTRENRVSSWRDFMKGGKKVPGDRSKKERMSVNSFPCKLQSERFEEFKREYGILEEWNPVLPGDGDVAFPFPLGKITLYADHFAFSHLRLPISRFCVEVLDIYKLHISQVHPLGLIKVYHHEFCCRGVKTLPSLDLFRALYQVVQKDDWFSFDKRKIDRHVVRHIPSSVKDKNWRYKFFYIDASVIPASMYYREPGAVADLGDAVPRDDMYKNDLAFKRFISQPTDIVPLSEHALVAVGMSRLWRNPSTLPTYEHVNGAAWVAYELLLPDRATYLRPVEMTVGADEKGLYDRFNQNFLLPGVVREEVQVSPRSKKAKVVSGSGEGSGAGTKQAGSSKALKPSAAVGKRALLRALSPESRKKRPRDLLQDFRDMKREALQALNIPVSGATGQGSAASSGPGSSGDKAPTMESADLGDREARKKLKVTLKDGRAPADEDTYEVPLKDKRVGAGKSKMDHPPIETQVITEPVDTSTPVFTPIAELGGGEKSAGSSEEPAGAERTYPSALAWDELDFNRPFVPRWDLTKGTRLSTPDVCRQFLVEAVPPNERQFVETRSNREISDTLAMSLATVETHAAELARRWILDDQYISRLVRENKEMEHELRRASTTARNANIELHDLQKVQKALREEHDGCVNVLAAERDEHVRDLLEKDRLIESHKEKETMMAGELARSVLLVKDRDRELDRVRGQLRVAEERRAIEVQALEEVVGQLKDDRRWLIVEGIPRSFEVARRSIEFRDCISKLAVAADLAGRRDGMADGKRFQEEGRSLEEHQCYKLDTEVEMLNAYQSLSEVSIGVMDEIVSTADNEDLSALKDMLASPIHGGSDEEEGSDGAEET